MTADTIASHLLARENMLNLRDSLDRAFRNARDGSLRWKELDGLWSRTCVRLRQASAPETDIICREAIDQIEAIAELDRRDREAERERQRAVANSARQFELRRQNRLAWAHRVSRPTLLAVNAAKDRLTAISAALTGTSESEADIREHLQDIGDALKSLSATVALEARASVAREAEASKAA